jgi:hypothetical protein
MLTKNRKLACFTLIITSVRCLKLRADFRDLDIDAEFVFTARGTSYISNTSSHFPNTYVTGDDKVMLSYRVTRGLDESQSHFIPYSFHIHENPVSSGCDSVGGYFNPNKGKIDMDYADSAATEENKKSDVPIDTKTSGGGSSITVSRTGSSEALATSSVAIPSSSDSETLFSCKLFNKNV